MTSSTTNTYCRWARNDLVHDVNNPFKSQDLRLGEEIIQRDNKGSDEWTMKRSHPNQLSYLTLIPNQIPYLRSGSQPILGFGGFGVIAAAERRSCSFREARVAYRISEVSRNVEARWVHFSFRVPGLVDFHVIHVTVTVVVIPSLSAVKSLLYGTLNPNDRLSLRVSQSGKTIHTRLSSLQHSEFQPCTMGPDVQ